MTAVRTGARATVLVIASTYPRWHGDPEPGFVHELSKRLAAHFRVIALVPDAPGADPGGVLDGVEVIRYRYAPRSLQTLVNDGGIITNLRRARWKCLLVPPMVLAQAWRTWRLVRALHVDAVHAHWLIPQGLIMAVMSALSSQAPPYLVTSHGADLFALRGRWLESIKRFVVRRAAAVTVVSQAMRDELASIGIDAAGIAVEPMGVDLSRRFTPDASVARSSHEMLFVGRLVEKKGLQYLIDAMPAVLAIHPDAFLTVAGFGPEEARLRMRVRESGLMDKVVFVGAVRQADLPALYRRAAVLVAPFVQAASGDREGLGLVVVEAIGCGCPVVVSDLPATRDVLPDSAGCTRVVPGDSRVLARAILDLLAAPDARHAAVAIDREQLVRKFDWDVVSNRYADILERLVAHGR